MLSGSNYNPDILTCLANLSSDEIFTSPLLANQILDMLPSTLWRDKNARFFDPVCKSGVFLREIARRLDTGLETIITDRRERVEHIFRNQIFGIAITELTALLSRRSLYCSKMANGKYSVCNKFPDEQGNIRFERITHSWKNGRCTFCRTSQQEYDRGIEMETHAYQFIHTDKPEEIFKMKFDVIIGNPPYQLSDAGDSTGSSPVYNLFVEQAKKLNPRFLSMIIPSRWFAGGKGLEPFRDMMLKDSRISRLVDYPIASDIFPGVKVIGGICYFLWERDRTGNCLVTTRMNGMDHSAHRSLDQFDTFVRFNQAIPILEKVNSKGYSSMSEIVSRQKPFGMRTFIRPSGKGNITLYANKKVGKIEKSAITSGAEMISLWKVLISMAYGEGGESRDYPRMILGKPIVAPPSSACTETYIVVGTFKAEAQANNMAKYLRTKFLRFLVGLRKNTQHITKDRFAFVPMLSMTRVWTDEKLYAHFGLSATESAFIESLVRPMDVEDE